MGDRSALPLPQGRFEICVVLVGVTHPGNLGAVCRSMLNFGFADLRLVNPKCDPTDGESLASSEACKITARARTTTCLHPRCHGGLHRSHWDFGKT